MSVPRQPMTDFVELEPLLVYRQEGGGRAPRLASWNATVSNQLPIPLFPFPSRPSFCKPEDETSVSNLDPGFQAAENAHLSPHGAHGLTSTKDPSGGSSVEEQQNQQDPRVQEINADNGLPSPKRRDSSTCPENKQKRKRGKEDSSPSKKAKTQDYRGLPPVHDGEQDPAEMANILPSPPNSLSPTAPSFSPLTPPSDSSNKLQDDFPIELSSGFPEDPWHYDAQEHRLALEAKHLRLWNRLRRNGNVNSASTVSQPGRPI